MSAANKTEMNARFYEIIALFEIWFVVSRQRIERKTHSKPIKVSLMFAIRISRLARDNKTDYILYLNFILKKSTDGIVNL